MSPIEIFAAAFSIVYVLLAVKNKASCFIFGLLGSLLWAYASYYMYNLKWDAFLNIFYAAMSIYGLWVWTGGRKKVAIPISRLPIKQHGITLAIAGLGTLLMAYIGQVFISSNYAFADALTTVLSIIGTLYIAQRYLFSWTYLLVADLIYIYIYFISGASIFMWMMVFYSFMAILGLIQWYKIFESETSISNPPT